MVSELPDRCRRCMAEGENRPLAGCRICLDQAMGERFLCQMVRAGGASAVQSCQAFRPHLMLVGKNASPAPLNAFPDKESYFAEVVRVVGAASCGGHGCSRSSCQGCGEDERYDRFHVVWAAYRRRTLFGNGKGERFIPFLHEIFLSCGRLIKGRVLLLWLAADHLHLFLETAPRENVREIIDDMQGLAGDALLQEFPELEGRGADGRIWEGEWFLERIGS